MTISLDLEENEIKTLFEFAGDLTGKRVLEIGCGDGRLTWRYASQAAQVVAIDPNPEKVSRAGQNLPVELSERVSFQAVGIEEFAAQNLQGDAGQFDLVLLSWSL
jgi:2-polyprenyl-3-methyl-5-hydroxy-6-metoxy-1,4-benzoquinol methylase